MPKRYEVILDSAGNAMRACTQCGTVKNLTAENFVRRSKHKTGFMAQCKDCNSKYYIADKERRSAISSVRFKSIPIEERRAKAAAIRAANPDAGRKALASWRSRNRERNLELRRTHEATRRARKQKGNGTFEADDVKKLISAQKGKCWWCQCALKKYHLDHRVPLFSGGLNSLSNIVVTCPSCNLKKGSKMPWQLQNPRLL